MMSTMSWLFFCVVVARFVFLGQTKELGANKPNILFILTDDQDVLLGSSERDVMPKLHSLVAEQGIRGTNMFANVPVCCPSRSVSS